MQHLRSMFTEYVKKDIVNILFHDTKKDCKVYRSELISLHCNISGFGIYGGKIINFFTFFILIRHN